MPSFKSRLLSAWALAAPALAAPALAALLPRTLDVERAHGRSHLVDSVRYQDDWTEATFRVPCSECLGRAGDDDAHEDDDFYLLSFRTHSEDTPCSSARIAVDGVYLHPDTVFSSTVRERLLNHTASGQGTTYSIAGTDSAPTRIQHLDLDWHSACLFEPAPSTDDTYPTGDATAQVLTVTIKAVDGRPIQSPAGFTISFSRPSIPELLKFEPYPDYSAGWEGNTEAWRNPPPHLRLASSQHSLQTDPKSPREHSESPGHLKLEAYNIEKAIQEKEDRLLQAELAKCGGTSCGVQRTLRVLRKHPKAAWRKSLKFLAGSAMGRPEDVHFFRPQVTYGTDLPYRPPPPYLEELERRKKLTVSQKVHIVLASVLGILTCGCVVVKVRQRIDHRCVCCHVDSKSQSTLRRRSYGPYVRRNRSARWRAWLSRRTSVDQARLEDYEEKRRLISSQEEILDRAMQAEIRQLRCAHVMVHSLIRAEEAQCVPPQTPAPSYRSYHGQGYTYTHYTHPNAPPSAIPAHLDAPARHANLGHCAYHPNHGHLHHHHNTNNTFPYNDFSSVPASPTTSTYDSRGTFSRPPSRSSTNSSLPGYPGYASSHGTAPPAYEEDEYVLGRVADGFRRYRPRGGSRGSLESDDSSDTRWTPESSVVDVSPRRSAETLRFPEYEDVEVGAATWDP